MIRESYFKLKEKRFKINESDVEKLNEDDFVELRTLGSDTSQVSLYYRINKGELFAVKKNILNIKLLNREFKNTK